MRSLRTLGVPRLRTTLIGWMAFPVPMQTYDVKPGHAGKIDFRGLFEICFDGCKEDDEWLIGSFGSMPMIRARQEGKKFVHVDTQTDKSFVTRMTEGDDEAMQIAQETQRRWNDFLEGVTGYNAKQRSKKAQEKAKKGS